MAGIHLSMEKSEIQVSDTAPAGARISRSAASSSSNKVISSQRFASAMSEDNSLRTGLAQGRVTTGSQLYVILKLKDQYGQAYIPPTPLSISFYLASGSGAGSFESAQDLGGGQYVAPFTATTAASNVQFGVAVEGRPLTPATPPAPLTIVSNQYSVANSLLSVSSSTVASGSSVTLTLRTYDVSGSAFTTGGLDVSFYSVGGGSSTGTFGPVTDLGDGTYSATWTGVLSGTAATLGAQISGNPLTSGNVIVSVTPGPATLTLGTGTGTQTVRAQLQGSASQVTFPVTALPAGLSSFALSAVPATATAGQPFSFTLTARDAYGNVKT
ncbi:hypothetical protein EB061_10200, partial [bacterium]|nr:hypothetical protein [bacterium]